jgi:transposase
MIDIDTRRVVDIIESREQDDVAKWLATYPNIQVVSRDGSAQYAAAIRQAHPDAVQVSDRFHLVKNLTDYAKQHISKIVSANFRISSPEKESSMTGGYWEKPENNGADLPEREHNASTEKKRIMVEKVRLLAERGIKIADVAKEVGVSIPTAKKYLDVGFSPENKGFGSKVSSKLKPYTDKINTMLRERYKFIDIEAALREDGYNGASSTIRMYATRQRRIVKAANAEILANTEIIERKWVTKLLYQPIEKVKEITESQLERIVAEYPVIGNLYDIVRAFKTMMFAKHVEKMDDWIKTASQLEVGEIDSFIRGISHDIEAVKNAIRYEYNNGLAEGSVNKLKVIKRIMYGRNSFQLLRNKLLIKELSRLIN